MQVNSLDLSNSATVVRTTTDFCFSLITVPGIFQSQHNSRPLSREPLRHYRSYQPANRRDISGVIQHTRKRFQPFLHALFIDIHHAHAFEVAPLLAADLRATL